MKNEQITLLLFDGVCNLCNSSVNFLIKIDSKAKIKFTAIQSVNGQKMLKQFGLENNYLDSLVFIKGDKYFIKSDAVLEVLDEIGGVWKIFYVFIYVPKPLRDFIYTFIAKSRYKIFGKRDRCMIPSEELRHRFLD